jgi:hypothetical protein
MMYCAVIELSLALYCVIVTFYGMNTIDARRQKMQVSKFDAQAVIDAGHPPVARRVVCVDFDGTIFPFGNLFNVNAQPIPGAVGAMRALKEAGYHIVVFSSRFSAAWHRHEGWDHVVAMREQAEFCEAMLDRWQIPFDDFTAEKIPAEAYFDDKAYRAEGDYGLFNAVDQFLSGSWSSENMGGG